MLLCILVIAFSVFARLRRWVMTAVSLIGAVAINYICRLVLRRFRVRVSALGTSPLDTSLLKTLLLRLINLAMWCFVMKSSVVLSVEVTLLRLLELSTMNPIRPSVKLMTRGRPKKC